MGCLQAQRCTFRLVALFSIAVDSPNIDDFDTASYTIIPFLETSTVVRDTGVQAEIKGSLIKGMGRNNTKCVFQRVRRSAPGVDEHLAR
jgi:hypothetical protein